MITLYSVAHSVGCILLAVKQQNV